MGGKKFPPIFVVIPKKPRTLGRRHRSAGTVEIFVFIDLPPLRSSLFHKEGQLVYNF